ncbi:MAG: TlpA family protein disulfide reductase [Gemmatimonadaceae bacterium]
MSSARVRSAVLAMTAVALASGCSSGDGAGAARVEVGSPVPEYSAVSLSGDSVSLAAQRGKVVILNVWATWCHPCRDEIPELQAIHEKYAARGLELVGVSVDTEGADNVIREFMRDFNMTYPVWRDPGERVSAQFHIVGVPATFLIDREGVLRWRKTGPIQPGDETLISAIEQALGS